MFISENFSLRKVISLLIFHIKVSKFTKPDVPNVFGWIFALFMPLFYETVFHKTASTVQHRIWSNLNVCSWAMIIQIYPQSKL